MSICPQITRRLKLQQLALLVALDDHRNMHRAAETIHLAQPSATNSLRRVESLFHARLFERTTRGLIPTEVGARVITSARRMLAEIERLECEVHPRHSSHCHPFVIGVGNGFLGPVLTHVLAMTKKRFPLFTIQLLERPEIDIIPLIVKGDVDLGVVDTVTPDMIGTMAIDYEPLDAGPVCLVARAGHPEARAQGLHCLLNKPWVFAPQPLPLRSLMDEEFARLGLPIPTNRIEINSITRTVEYVLGTDAVAVLPLWAVGEHLASKQLVRIPVALSGNLRHIALLRRRGESLAAGAAALFAALRASAKDPRESTEVGVIRQRVVCA